MPTDDSSRSDLSLAELDRLERAAAEEAQRGDDIFARRQLDWACRDQLRPLLDLVARMEKALVCSTAGPGACDHCNPCLALAEYRRAKGQA